MTVDITPSTEVLRSMMAQGHFTHAKALAEWIDNAIDAGAKTIEVVFGKSHGAPFVRVSDDGCGTDNMIAFVRLGESNTHRTTRSGFFGVGAKDSAFWYGGETSTFTVVSRTTKTTGEVVCHWPSVARNKWGIDDPTFRETADGESTGTTIAVSPAKAPPQGADWDRLLETLGYIYTPALRAGVQVKLRRGNRKDWELLRPWSRPELVPESIVDTRIDVNGKCARVFAGMVPDGTINRRPGLTYFHGFRVIKEASSRGCGNAEIRRVSGFVEIDNNWRRTKNKDDLVNAEALYDAVQAAIQPLLDRAEAAGMQIQNAAFTQEVATRINVSLSKNTAKAKRGKGTKKGTVEPTGTGGSHKRAANVQKGETFPGPYQGSGANGGAFRVAWSRLGERAFARVCGRTVELNEDFGIVSRAIAEKNAHVIVTLALSAIAADEARHDGSGQRHLRIDGVEDRDVGKILSALLWDASAEPAATEATDCAAE